MRRSSDLRAVARRAYWDARDARRIVDAWRRSGKPASVFAGELGIDPRRVSRWAARLHDETEEAVQFVPVHVADMHGGSGTAIRIELPQGCRIRVPPGFVAEDLRRVLAILDERGTC